MTPVATNLTQWIHGYIWGFVSAPVAYYVLKNLGGNAMTDVQNIWSKLFNKTTTNVSQ